MSTANLDKWHSHLKGELEGGLDALLADDCTFHSPIVFTPQEGKDLTKLYLGAAGNTFSEGDKEKMPGSEKSEFRYIKQIADGDHVLLEFETKIDGKYVNGVDLMTFNADGQITEFKVMIRPLQAINLMHAKMKAMLDSMAPQAS